MLPVIFYISTKKRPFSWRPPDWLIEHGLTSPPTQYRLYGRLNFYRSQDPTNSIKVLKEKRYKGKPRKSKKKTKFTYTNWALHWTVSCQVLHIHNQYILVFLY